MLAFGIALRFLSCVFLGHLTTGFAMVTVTLTNCSPDAHLLPLLPIAGEMQQRNGLSLLQKPPDSVLATVGSGVQTSILTHRLCTCGRWVAGLGSHLTGLL